MRNDEFFFPRLKRRDAYSRKRDGQYYVYNTYKQEIREDCLGRCVYCDAHENENGGLESMNLDHFRPQKYVEHEHLINDPNNLVWSCSGCNRLKSDEWPALGTLETFIGNEGFVDPFVEDRLEFFALLSDGEIRAKKSPADYMIQLLALNRASRKRLRELRSIHQTWLKEFEQSIGELRALVEDPELSNGSKSVLAKHADWLEKMKQALRAEFFNCKLY